MSVKSAIAKGGLTGGTLDIIYAFIVYGPLTFGLYPNQVLQSVAAGWVGRETAMAGGAPTALLGLVTHFGIAMGMAGIYVLAALRLRALLDRPVLWGVIYGFILYVGMNYVVTPLSAAATGHFPADLGEITARLRDSFSTIKPKDNVPLLLGTIFTHTVLVALPIALIARKDLSGRRAAR